MQTPSNKISLSVHHLLGYLTGVKKLTKREMVQEAIKFYKGIYAEIDVNNTPCQNPLIYPQPTKFVQLEDNDRKYLETLPVHHSRKMPEALDRVLITYQNKNSDIEVPDHLRVNWMDTKYLNWMESCP